MEKITKEFLTSEYERIKKEIRDYKINISYYFKKPFNAIKNKDFLSDDYQPFNNEEEKKFYNGLNNLYQGIFSANRLKNKLEIEQTISETDINMYKNNYSRDLFCEDLNKIIYPLFNTEDGKLVLRFIYDEILDMSRPLETNNENIFNIGFKLGIKYVGETLINKYIQSKKYIELKTNNII